VSHKVPECGATVLEFVLEDVEVIGGGHGDDVLRWMPGRVQNLFVEVQTLDANLVLLALSAGAHLSRLEHNLGLGDLSRRLKRHVPFGVAVEHAEKIVVRPSHDGRIAPIPAAFKLVKDAVILVEATQFCPKVFVHLVALDGLRVHVQVPHFDGEIIPGDDIPPAIAKLHVRYTGNYLGKEATVRRVFRFLE